MASASARSQNLGSRSAARAAAGREDFFVVFIFIALEFGGGAAWSLVSLCLPANERGERAEMTAESTVPVFFCASRSTIGISSNLERIPAGKGTSAPGAGCPRVLSRPRGRDLTCSVGRDMEGTDSFGWSPWGLVVVGTSYAMEIDPWGRPRRACARGSWARCIGSRSGGTPRP